MKILAFGAAFMVIERMEMVFKERDFLGFWFYWNLEKLGIFRGGKERVLFWKRI
jgi:hypothetical protein